jgi:hypothetical protein
MKARPILFSGPMIRALLDGRKTQTRRIIKPQPEMSAEGKAVRMCGHLGPASYLLHDVAPRFWCPYGKPGDLLWVRESGLELREPINFRLFVHDAVRGRFWVDCDGGRYGASFNPDAVSRDFMTLSGQYKVRPSIHMPRWASRLTLEITDVRVQRLQDISEEDAVAEGITDDQIQDYLAIVESMEQIEPDPARCLFEQLWNDINGAGAWDANPFVWCLSFRVHRCNVDALLKERAA